MAISQDKVRILIVDDEPGMVEVIQRNLTSEGYLTFTASGVAEAVKLLESVKIDLVVTDLKMPGVTGLDLIRHVRDNLRDVGVIMITGYASVESAVEAVKTGADDYLPKPFTHEELLAAVGTVLEKLHRRRMVNSEASLPQNFQGLIGESPVMMDVYRAISRASETSATVLVTGESGTGKELVARAVHYGGKRASAPFVPVNCGGIPEALFESELFGHVKGSFTGATETRAGFFQTAQGGTIFLDEVSETSPAMQVKLLRVLQDKEVYMVGATKPQKVDTRIIAATNKDLLNLVSKGQFREDLYFRLNVLTIVLPPLRDRGDDILLLGRHFADKFTKEFSRAELKFSDDTLDALAHYDWPGNVRELENVMQRLVVMREGDVIDVPDLPMLMRFSASRQVGLERTLAEVEAEHIKNVLSNVNFNKTRAAKILGIDRKTLREKLKSYNLGAPDIEP